MADEQELSAEKRFHRFGNALQVVSGAVSALDLYDAELTKSDKAQLEDSITRGIENIEALLDLGGTDAEPAGSGALVMAAQAARARGIDVRLEGSDVPAMRDDGDELASLLTELLSASCPPTGDVIVSASEAGDRVAIELAIRREDVVRRRLVVHVASA